MADNWPSLHFSSRLFINRTSQTTQKGSEESKTSDVETTLRQLDDILAKLSLASNQTGISIHGRKT